MKKRYLFLLLSLAAMPLMAQMKIDIAGGQLLEQYKLMKQGREVLNPDLRLVGNQFVANGVRTMDASASTDVADNEVGAIVTLAPGATSADITLDGAVKVVTEFSDNLVSVALPVSRIEELMELDAVEFVSLGYLKQASMKYARASAGVDDVHAGSGLERPYKGAGVIVGMFDTGIDPNHINFTRADNTDESRVKLVYAYKGNNGIPTTTADTPESIAMFTTDLSEKTHGTHVMGIAAGAYNGVGTYRDNTTLYSDAPSMPLYGVAPEADVVMAGGYLYNNNITNGVERLISYAESQGKPAVINLSLGALLGAHDGTDSECKALAKLGERAIICIAAGNDAGSNCAFTMSGGLQASSLKNTVGISNYTAGTDTHQLLVWGDGSEPFTKFEFVIMNVSTKEVVYSREIGNLNGSTVGLGGSSAPSSYEKPGGAFDEAFTTNSYITFRSFVNGSNNIYVVEMTHRLYAGTNTLYRPCLRVTRTKGQVVTGQYSGGEFTNFGLTGTYKQDGVTYAALTNGTDNGSISAMATGENVLVVGAYTSAVNFGLLSGGGYSYTGHSQVNEMTTFSSYGKNTATGESLPHISAPGSALLSSFNTYYVPGGTKTLYGESSGTAVKDGRSYYWGPMQGTSMACPFVTGTVALWLEGDPNLTVNDVKDIAAKTAVKTNQYLTGSSDKKLQWGAGGIQALEGLKEVLSRRAGIGSVWADDNARMVVSQTPGLINVLVAGESRLDARLYSMTGALVSSRTAADQELTIAADGLQKGVYLLDVQGAEGRYTQKLIVK